MNSYAIELKDGSVIQFDADFIEMQDGFFFFYKDNMSEASPEVIKYQSFDSVNHITLQKEYTPEKIEEQLRGDDNG